jgi:hypothetical protein
VKYGNLAIPAFENDPAYNNEAITDHDYFIVRVTAEDGTSINYHRVDVRVG